ncbi:hypothetical protein SUGI_0563810 [Cryptomeria japonica]|nr:hypothetical protein SUGI_0563810 [Cryptomeria japonica]
MAATKYKYDMSDIIAQHKICSAGVASHKASCSLRQSRSLHLPLHLNNCPWEILLMCSPRYFIPTFNCSYTFSKVALCSFWVAKGPMQQFTTSLLLHRNSHCLH